MCQLISLSGAHHLPSWAVREQRRAWGLLGWEESLLGRAIREGSMGEGFTCHVYLALKVEGKRFEMLLGSSQPVSRTAVP